MLERIRGERPQCGGGVLAALAFAPKLKFVEQRLSPCHDESVMEFSSVHCCACALNSRFFRWKIFERLFGGAGAPRTIVMDERYRAAHEFLGDAISGIFDQFPIALHVRAAIPAGIISEGEATVRQRIE